MMNSTREHALAEVAHEFLERALEGKALERALKEASGRHKLHDILTAAEVREFLLAKGVAHEKLLALRTRRVRSSSGVSVIAVMTAPLPCPGKCIYCPGGPEVGSAKSYTGFEPASLRAKRAGFDPRLQIEHRLAQLEAIGHPTSKCDVIVMGGTFNALHSSYQESFVKGIYDGFNGTISKSIPEAIALNEHAEHRVIGLTFETRPDHTLPGQVQELLNYGCTRIELGVQSLDDHAYEITKREQTIADVARSTRECKDAFLKIVYHLMPGLFVEEEQDVQNFKRVFSDEAFRPDMIKIYPTLVMPGTPLHEMWSRGEYAPLTTERAAALIARMHEFIPRYARVMRIDRDIPTTLVSAGVKQSNLRQLVDDELDARGIACQCIRCREIGLNKGIVESVSEERIDYSASGGKEAFVALNNQDDLLIGFGRLRLHSDGHRAGVRELRVYGQEAVLGERNALGAQHKGFGSQLLQRMEKIAFEEWGVRVLAVTAGVGVREYYARKGYALDGAYMVKRA